MKKRKSKDELRAEIMLLLIIVSVVGVLIGFLAREQFVAFFSSFLLDK